MTTANREVKKLPTFLAQCEVPWQDLDVRTMACLRSLRQLAFAPPMPHSMLQRDCLKNGGPRKCLLFIAVPWCPGAESNHRHCDFQLPGIDNDFKELYEVKIAKPDFSHPQHALVLQNLLLRY
jgi:hypothetical protein